MSIVFPIALPLANVSSGASKRVLLTNTIAAVLGGATFGDHCSPISDTTVLSAAACRVKTIEHVKTQLPYVCFPRGASRRSRPRRRRGGGRERRPRVAAATAFAQALTAGCCATFLGYLAHGYGVPDWLLIVSGFGFMPGIFYGLSVLCEKFGWGGATQIYDPSQDALVGSGPSGSIASLKRNCGSWRKGGGGERGTELPARLEFPLSEGKGGSNLT